MSITVGRKHGNGYHGNIYCKISINHSQGFRDLLEYENLQLRDHLGVIYEREFLPSWIERICIRCPTTYPPKYILKKGNVYECFDYGLIKIPNGVEYREEKKKDG